MITLLHKNMYRKYQENLPIQQQKLTKTQKEQEQKDGK